jgi:hypothetical protein
MLLLAWEPRLKSNIYMPRVLVIFAGCGLVQYAPRECEARKRGHLLKPALFLASQARI